MTRTHTRLIDYQRLEARGKSSVLISKLMMACNDMQLANEAASNLGGCEFRPFCNPLYYMSQMDFPMSAAHACHQATSDGQYDRKSSDDADSRSTLRARVHRIYLSAPVDAQAGAEV